MTHKLSTTLFLFVLAFHGTAQYSGGSGTPEDLFQIALLSDLQYLGEHSNDVLAISNV